MIPKKEFIMEFVEQNGLMSTSIGQYLIKSVANKKLILSLDESTMKEWANTFAPKQHNPLNIIEHQIFFEAVRNLKSESEKQPFIYEYSGVHSNNYNKPIVSSPILRTDINSNFDRAEILPDIEDNINIPCFNNCNIIQSEFQKQVNNNNERIMISQNGDLEFLYNESTPFDPLPLILNTDDLYSINSDCVILQSTDFTSNNRNIQSQISNQSNTQHSFNNMSSDNKENINISQKTHAKNAGNYMLIIKNLYKFYYI